MQASSKLAALVRARLFELVDTIGRVAARLGADPLDASIPPRMQLKLFGRGSSVQGGAATVVDPALQWDVSTATGNLATAALTIDRKLSPPANPGSFDVGRQSVVVRREYDVDGGTGEASAKLSTSRILPSSAAELYVESVLTPGLEESSARWLDQQSPGTSDGRLSGMGRGMVGYAFGTGGAPAALGAGGIGRLYDTGGNNGTFGAGLGVPVKVRADRQYIITVNVRAISPAGATVPLRFFPTYGGVAIAAAGDHWALIPVGTYSGFCCRFLWIAPATGQNYLNCFVQNHGAVSCDFYLDTGATFLTLEDVGGNRWVEQNGGASAGGPAPYPANVLQSIEGPWTDA